MTNYELLIPSKSRAHHMYSTAQHSTVHAYIYTYLHVHVKTYLTIP